MYVGLRMLRDFKTVTPSTPVKDARRLLDESGLWMLIVVKEGSPKGEHPEIVGYLRKEDISEALPSVMTTLDKHEANYLLSKLTVEKIIRRDITTVHPEDEIETAAQIMHEKNLAGLAVVDEAGRLLGYINRTVMLEVLVDEMGLKQGGSRITFEIEDRPGVLHEVSGIIAGMDVSIIATATFFHKDRRIVVVRVAMDDATPVAVKLQEKGYTLVSPQDFVKEWL